MVRASVFLLLVWIASGCAKQRECKETSDAINAAVTRIEGMGLKGDDPAAMKKSVEDLGRAAEEEAERVGKLSITTEELKRDVESYKRMLEEVAKISKQLHTVLETAQRLEEGAKKSEKDVQDAIDALQRECERGAAGCQEVAEKMKEGPTGNEDEKTFLKALKKFKSDLESLQPADAKVAEAVAKLVKAVDGQAVLLDKALKAEQDVDRTVEAMDKAVEPEDRIVDSINKLCL